MGCICSKESSVHHYIASNSEDQKEKGQNESTVDVLTPPKSEEIVVEVGKGGHNEPDNTKSKTVLQASASGKDKIDKTTRIFERPTIANFNARISLDMGIHGMPHAIAGEQTSAGWPSWLTSVAAEAIQGWLPRSADSFEKLHKIGQGTYSSVYKARDLKTGKTVAMKKVRFANMDPESVRFMAREINILRKLDHPNIMKLESIVTSRMSTSLYLVFEYMEHDLAGLAASPKIKFSEPQIKCYMQQLLCGLQHCHSSGVLHRDIKGSNLLIDNNGVLKIGDFGLATFFHPDQKQPLTSRVVTLWYRAPELLLGETEYGTAIDLWSVGCILVELFAGKPIMPGRTEVEQIHKIFKLCGSPTEEYWKKSKLPHATSFKPQHLYKRRVREAFKDIPSSALSLVDVLLAIEPLQRGTADSALASEFFTAKPLPCDPSSLPKYPPSKEFDARLREEEARRKKTEAAKGHGPESVRRGSKQSEEALTPEIDGQEQLNGKNYNNQQEGGTSFVIDPHRRLGKVTSSLSTSMVHPNAVGYSWTNEENGAYLGPGRISPSGQGSKLRRQTSYIPQLVSGMSNPYSKGEETTLSAKESTGYVRKRSRMHCSGPLMPPGGNLEDMLKEHERQIQEAVRKARLDKERNVPASQNLK